MHGDFAAPDLPVLSGEHVRLEPLQAMHLDALIAVGSDPAIWAWYPESAATPDGMRRFVEVSLAARAAGTALPFVQIDAASGRIIGSTRFGAFDQRHRRAEIGWTWLAPAYQRTPINTESKYLMLRHAFEALGLMRVEFKTDVLNEKSRRALKRIGASEEGVFRRHMLTESGRVRDSVYFSVVDVEWPHVKRHLETLLAPRF
ncbi:GNAT family N-acetyltransferase [Solimonas terrae]|uniref:GNAT family N-acetyltransferase n=1 Tax=Solimonas terrae TaxID=1396819 RepID=A0A6M2BMK8_9GAMM|nr:GNAT family protein [Solimonas terrae]NGY03530.1 GNAT family N-acetyltransferase [Solimonas terrae]